MNISKTVAFLLYVYTIAAYAQTVVDPIGIGARSLGMGNNYTALSSDYSAIYYNPAGLAFLPVREVQISGIMMRQTEEALLAGQTATADRWRVGFSTIGFVQALPTTQGGFTLAGGYASPYLLDDVSVFNGTDTSNRTDILYAFTPATNLRDTFSLSGVPYTRTKESFTHGQLNLWNIAAGWQVAPNVGVGVTASFITGNTNRLSHKVAIGTAIGRYATWTLPESSNSAIATSYLGYDIRLGVMWRPTDILQCGLRLELPRHLWFSQTEVLTDLSNNSVYTESFTGTEKSSFSGAAGVAGIFSWGTLTSDFVFRTPNPDAPANSDLAQFKLGAGCGLEVPIKPISSFVRLGYSYGDLDLFPHQTAYDDIILPNNGQNISVVHNRQMVTAGLGILSGSSTTIDIGYGYTFYDFYSTDSDWQNSVLEHHGFSRGTATLTVRY